VAETRRELREFRAKRRDYYRAEAAKVNAGTPRPRLETAWARAFRLRAERDRPTSEETNT